jgi:hypothetical protein
MDVRNLPTRRTAHGYTAFSLTWMRRSRSWMNKTGPLKSVNETPQLSSAGLRSMRRRSGPHRFGDEGLLVRVSAGRIGQALLGEDEQ